VQVKKSVLGKNTESIATVKYRGNDYDKYTDSIFHGKNTVLLFTVYLPNTVFRKLRKNEPDKGTLQMIPHIKQGLFL